MRKVGLVFRPNLFILWSGECEPFFLMNGHGWLGRFGQPTLLENGPWAPAEKGLRHRFPNRCPATATNGLALRHRVSQPVP